MAVVSERDDIIGNYAILFGNQYQAVLWYIIEYDVLLLHVYDYEYTLVYVWFIGITSMAHWK